MRAIIPVVGDWYKRPRSNVFEVVAIDEEDRTIEVQHFDGTVEEIDHESWDELLVESAVAPEDWSGSMDMDREDYRLDDGEGPGNGWASPLDYLDRADS